MDPLMGAYPDADASDEKPVNQKSEGVHSPFADVVTANLPVYGSRVPGKRCGQPGSLIVDTRKERVARMKHSGLLGGLRGLRFRADTKPGSY
jgi:hypothetical protein